MLYIRLMLAATCCLLASHRLLLAQTADLSNPAPRPSPAPSSPTPPTDDSDNSSASPKALPEITWRVPEPVYLVDFRDRRLEPQLVFGQQGVMLQVPLNFAMLRHEKVTIRSRLPEPGTFHVKLTNPRAAIEIVPQKSPGNPLLPSVDIASKIPLRDVEGLKAAARNIVFQELDNSRKQALREFDSHDEKYVLSYFRKLRIKVPSDEQKWRKLYLDYRTVDLGRSLLSEKLIAFADQHSSWVNAKERSDWQALSPYETFDVYVDLRACLLGEKYLQGFGFTLEEAGTKYRTLIFTKVAAVHVFLTHRAKESLENSRALTRGLSGDELAHLRTLASVTLQLQFIPPTDEQDPNSQWFNGQRIATGAEGVESIRVEGKLDPRQRDRSDWWTLLDYDEDKITFQFDPNPRCEVQMFRDSKQRLTHLRVAAKNNESTSYSFEFRPLDPQGNDKVILHETPSRVKSTFPF